jgi:hypothetical protein
MNQNRKYYAKNDILYLADFQNEENPQTDFFKQIHVLKKKKN